MTVARSKALCVVVRWAGDTSILLVVPSNHLLQRTPNFFERDNFTSGCFSVKYYFIPQ